MPRDLRIEIKNSRGTPHSTPPLLVIHHFEYLLEVYEDPKSENSTTLVILPTMSKIAITVKRPRHPSSLSFSSLLLPSPYLFRFGSILDCLCLPHVQTMDPPSFLTGWFTMTSCKIRFWFQSRFSGVMALASQESKVSALLIVNSTQLNPGS